MGCLVNRRLSRSREGFDGVVALEGLDGVVALKGLVALESLDGGVALEGLDGVVALEGLDGVVAQGFPCRHGRHGVVAAMIQSERIEADLDPHTHTCVHTPSLTSMRGVEVVVRIPCTSSMHRTCVHITFHLALLL